MSVIIVVGDAYMALGFEKHGPLKAVGFDLNTNTVRMVSGASGEIDVPAEAIAFYARMNEALEGLNRFLREFREAGNPGADAAHTSLVILEGCIGRLMVRE